jgi:hypothetical protein
MYDFGFSRRFVLVRVWYLSSSEAYTNNRIYMQTNLVWVYFCRLFYMHTSRAKVYPAKELEHGLRPNKSLHTLTQTAK